MKEKANKPKSKSVAKSASVRVHQEAKARAALLLLAANKKKAGRKIKFEDLFELALGLVTDEHLKLLQDRSLTFEDRKELLRQQYIASRGQISRDSFLGFLMSADFVTFQAEQNQALNVSEMVRKAATDVAS
jgi:hypothetical protein